jgi:hypothetical protein
MKENKIYLDESHPVEVERRRLTDGKIDLFSHFEVVHAYRTALISQMQSENSVVS